jgi:hypothetical protein
LHAHEAPSDAMMQELLEAWLAMKGDPSSPAQPLESVDDIRESNRSLLDRCLPLVASLVKAWHAKSGADTPEIWSDLQQLRDTLGASGCLDFVELGELDLVAWLDALDLWPSGMSATVDAMELGLSAAEIAEGGASAAKSDETRRRRRTQLKFGERTFDTATGELQELIEAVAASVDDEFLRTRPTPVRLSMIRPPARRPGGSDTGTRGAPRSYGGPKPTPEQNAAIGLAGEVLAYRWLQAAYRETTPDSWVSASRTFRLGGHPGDDALGYDFRIARKSETLLFEVKATTTDEYEFDIGESELREARRARKGCYRIIFIKSILLPEERELLVLPNPLEGDFAESFVQINQGIRLRFDPTPATR